MDRIRERERREVISKAQLRLLVGAAGSPARQLGPAGCRLVQG
jgi:hypothetical protein